VLGALAPYVVVKYDVERGNGIDASQQFDVNALPTILLVNSNGESVDRFEGVPEGGPQQLADWLKSGVTKSLPTDTLEKRVSENPQDAVALIALAERKKKDNKNDEALALLRRAREADPDDALGIGSEAAWTVGLIDTSGQNGEVWFDFLIGYVKTYPRADRTTMAIDWLTAMPEVQAVPQLQQLVRPVLGAYVEANPRNVNRMRRAAYGAARIHLDDLATAFARKLVEIDPTGQSRSDLASCLAAGGKRDEAEKVCSEAMGTASEEEKKLIERRLADIKDGNIPPELIVRGAPWSPKSK